MGAYNYGQIRDWVQQLAQLEKSAIGPGQQMVHKKSRQMIRELHQDLLDAQEKLDCISTIMEMTPFEIDNVRSDSNV